MLTYNMICSNKVEKAGQGIYVFDLYKFAEAEDRDLSKFVTDENITEFILEYITLPKESDLKHVLSIIERAERKNAKLGSSYYDLAQLLFVFSNDMNGRRSNAFDKLSLFLSIEETISSVEYAYVKITGMNKKKSNSSFDDFESKEYYLNNNGRIIKEALARKISKKNSALAIIFDYKYSDGMTFREKLEFFEKEYDKFCEVK